MTDSKYSKSEEELKEENRKYEAWLKHNYGNKERRRDVDGTNNNAGIACIVMAEVLRPYNQMRDVLMCHKTLRLNEFVELCPKFRVLNGETRAGIVHQLVVDELMEFDLDLWLSDEGGITSLCFDENKEMGK